MSVCRYLGYFDYLKKIIKKHDDACVRACARVCMRVRVY